MKIIKQSRITLNMFKSIRFVLFPPPKVLKLFQLREYSVQMCQAEKTSCVFSQSLVLGFIKCLARHVPPQGKNKEQNILREEGVTCHQ